MNCLQDISLQGAGLPVKPVSQYALKKFVIEGLYAPVLQLALFT